MDSPKPTIGVVLTLLELYRTSHPDMPAQFGAMWKDTLKSVLSDAAGLHFTDVAHTPGEVAAAVKSCEAANCDALLVLPIAYAASGSAREALCDSKLPLIVVSTTRDATLPHDMSTDHIMANHAMHGVQDLANVLARNGRAFEMIAGHESDANFRARLVQAVKTASGARVLRQGKIGRLGKPFEGMLDFAFDPKVLAEALGFETVEIAPKKLAGFAEKVSEQRAGDLLAWAKETFEIDAAMTSSDFNTSAVWALALEDMVEANGLDALTMNFLEVSAAGAKTLPFLGACRLLSRGTGYAGEGDVLTAALVTALARMTGEATFTEMFCPDYARSGVLLSHMGECNFAMADPAQPVRLISKEFAFGEAENPATPVFQLRPGRATLASLTQWHHERFRLVATVCEVLAAPEHPNLESPYSRISFGRELPGLLEDYSRAGGTHHMAMAYGDRTGDLAALCRLCGVELVTV